MDGMKQAKKLTRDQKACARAHYLNPKEWALIRETLFFYHIINKETGRHRFLDKAVMTRK